MGKQILDVVFILDCSHAAAGLEGDFTEHFNKLLQTYRQADSKTHVTTILSSAYYGVLHDRVPICNVPLLRANQYPCGGKSAILDAVGTTMKRFYHQAEDRVVFIVLTAGQDDASTQFSIQSLQHLMKAYPNWEFRFPVAAFCDFVCLSQNQIRPLPEVLPRDYDILDENLRAFRDRSCAIGKEWDALSRAWSQH